MRIGLLFLVLAPFVQADFDPGELLLKVRENVLETVDRLPRYLCTQTIDRSQYEPDRDMHVKDCEELDLLRGVRWKLLHTVSDRLRLDVAIAGQREIYSWSGENQFGDKSLFDIVNEGSISTGYFNGFLQLVFRTDNANFSYVGEAIEGQRKLAEYQYRVPVEASHYFIGPRKNSVATAYQGTVLVDPATATLVRLTVRTSNLRSESGSCEATTTMNFGSFHLRDRDFLMPSQTDLEIRNLNGVETKNRTVYSACQEFRGESTVRFDGPLDAPPTSQRAVSGQIPPGLHFALALREDIPVATAAAGQTVKAELTSDLRDAAKKMIAPKGTQVLFRILQIRRYYYGSDAKALGRLIPLSRVELLLRMENLGLATGDHSVFAQLELVPGLTTRGRARTLQSRPMELGPLNAIGGNRWFVRFERAGDDYVIKSGLTSNWITVAP